MTKLNLFRIAFLGYAVPNLFVLIREQKTIESVFVATLVGLQLMIVLSSMPKETDKQEDVGGNND